MRLCECMYEAPERPSCVTRNDIESIKTFFPASLAHKDAHKVGARTTLRLRSDLHYLTCSLVRSARDDGDEEGASAQL